MKIQSLNKPKPTSGVLRHNIIGHSVDQENVQVTVHPVLGYLITFNGGVPCCGRERL